MRIREYRTEVAEPGPGRILNDPDIGSGAVTIVLVTPQDPARPVA